MQAEAEDLRRQQSEIADKLVAKDKEIEQARLVLDAADVDVVEKRRAVAHPLPGTHLADAQVAAVSMQVASFQTLLHGARDTVTKPEVAALLPPEVKNVLDALYTGFAGVHAALPPELRQIPQTSAPPDGVEPAAGVAAGTARARASGGAAASGAAVSPAAAEAAPRVPETAGSASIDHDMDPDLSRW